MSPSHQDTVLDRVLDPLVRCFTPEVARQIAALRADPKLQARLDSLARKANEDELTEDEREEYDAYVEAIDVVSMLQAKARQILKDNATP